MNSKASSLSKLVRSAINWKTWVLILGVIWMFTSRATSTSNLLTGPPPRPKEGFGAPDFTLDLLEGGQVTLSEHRGQPVVFNSWVTWCGPCREEMPAIEKVFRDYKDQGPVLIGLNLTSQETEPSIDEFVVADLGIQWVALRRPLKNPGTRLNFFLVITLPAAAQIFLEAFRGGSLLWFGGLRTAKLIGLGVLVVMIVLFKKKGRSCELMHRIRFALSRVGWIDRSSSSPLSFSKLSFTFS